MWELDRLKRYASWIRRLDVREWGLSRETTRPVVYAPTRIPLVLSLHLRESNWCLNETNLSFLPKFLSPHLTTTIVTTNIFFHPDETIDP